MTTTGKRTQADSKWWLRIVPENARLLRNAYFWRVAGVAFCVIVSFTLLCSFPEPVTVALVVSAWFAICAMLLLRWTNEFRLLEQSPPTLEDLERWHDYDVDLRTLYTKVHARPESAREYVPWRKKGHEDLNWKRDALASATVSIRSRSYFREGEESSEESAIASQYYGSK